MRIATVLNCSLTATLAAALVAGLPTPADAKPLRGGAASRSSGPPAGTQRPSREVLLSVGQGELVNLPASITDIWVSNPAVADVYVRSPRQINLFGKDFGEATVFATGPGGKVIYSANVRVSQNITSIDAMLKAAMPDAAIKVTTVGQLAVLTGTVASPDDAAQAKQLVTAILNPGIDPSGNTPLKVGVVSRLKTATPLQVNLQVRFAEVNRSFVKNIGVNLVSGDGTGGFKFGIGQGRNIGPQFNPGGPLGVGVTSGATGTSIVTTGASGSTLGLAGHLLGLDLLSAIDLGETTGQVSTLANPNLTALSGETGTFLAGGEIPIPLAQALGTISVEYKQYGVSLAYTPTVLGDGRISLRVRPEVSQLDYSNAVTLGGTRVPGLTTTRRAETTVELGSGQSFMIGGLLQHSRNNSYDKAPFLGDIPILGALFRSNSFQRNETELVIIITPYLVKPVSNPADVALPTDGGTTPTTLGRVLLGDLGGGVSGAHRPLPTMAAPTSATPVIGAVAPSATAPKKGTAPVAPGFTGN